MEGQGRKGGGSWCKAVMVSFEGIIGVMGWKALAVWLYSLALPKSRHWWKRMVKKISREWWEWGIVEAREDFS